MRTDKCPLLNKEQYMIEILSTLQLDYNHLSFFQHGYVLVCGYDNLIVLVLTRAEVFNCFLPNEDIII